MDLNIVQRAFNDELEKIAEAKTTAKKVVGGVLGAVLGAGIGGYAAANVAAGLGHAAPGSPAFQHTLGLGAILGALGGGVAGGIAGTKAMFPPKEKTAAELTPESRAHVAKKNFAVSAKASNTGKPAYPIPDKAHARAALGFAAMHHDAKDLAEVRKDVARKFPGMVKEKKAGIDAALFKAAAHTAGEYLKAGLKGVSEELPTAAGAMAGLAAGKMYELKTGRHVNPIASSGMGYGAGGLLDVALRKHHG